MKIKNLKNNLLKLAILLIPFEGLGLPINDSYWSPSYILLLTFFCFGFCELHIFYKKKIFYGSLLLILFLLLNSIAAGKELDFARYLRSAIAFLVFVWVSVINFSPKQKWEKKKEIYQIFRLSVSICCFFIYLQFILTNYLNIQLFSDTLFPNIRFAENRYQGFMGEPSYAGYVIASLLSYEIFLLLMLFKELKFKDIFQRFLFICFLLLALYLTSSTHMLTLVLAIFISIIIESKSFLKKLFKAVQKNIFVVTSIFIPVISILGVYFSSEHFQKRFFGQQTNNVSTLSWLRGYENMMTTLKYNPLLGYGLGNNYRAFEDSAQTSLYQNILEKSNLSELNKHDSFSLFFRLFTEGGFILTIFIFYLIIDAIYKSILNKSHTKFVDSNAFNIKYNNDIKFGKYYYVIFMAACLGALLKEPSYYNYLIPLTVMLL